MAVFCTFCNQEKKRCTPNEMCSDCARESEALEAKFLAEQAQSHRKCRTCSKVLPKSRYLHCTECVLESSRETDDALMVYFESPDSENRLEYGTGNYAQKKKCKGLCGQEKPRVEFRKLSGGIDQRSSACRPCEKLIYAKWWRARVAKRQARLAREAGND